MKTDKSFLGMIILLVIVGALSVILYFRQMVDSGSIEISRLPMEISEWKGEDIPLDERTYAVLETRNALMREYKNPKDEDVYLYIVFSDINRRVAHPPEVCYTGGGIEIVEKAQSQFNVPGLEETLLVNSFVSRKDGSESLVYYWYKTGDRFTARYLTQQAKAALNQMMGKMSAVALIRISTAINNGDKEKASQTLQEFSRKVIPLILERTP